MVNYTGISNEIDESEIQSIIRNCDKLIIFGYGLDYINNKRLGLDKWPLNDKQREEDLIMNVYHGRVVDFNFSLRRKTVERVRSLVRKATIKFLPSGEFLSEALSSIDGYK